MKVIQAQDEEATGIDVAPLIDILFTLIIFFLVTTTFQDKEKEEEVRLPRQGGSSLVNKDRPFYINVLQDGTYSVGGDIVQLDDLELKLKLRFEEKPDQKLVLRGDSKAFHGQTASALDVARRVGFTKASIAYDTRPLN
ncbi:MAG: biopolymer transporter ExbD [Verrucomicrobiota bacterium]|nr:biopolymer transporter ExbD [Verrucomicrobiota bacterium]